MPSAAGNHRHIYQSRIKYINGPITEENKAAARKRRNGRPSKRVGAAAAYDEIIKYEAFIRPVIAAQLINKSAEVPSLEF